MFLKGPRTVIALCNSSRGSGNMLRPFHGSSDYQNTWMPKSDDWMSMRIENRHVFRVVSAKRNSGLRKIRFKLIHKDRGGRTSVVTFLMFLGMRRVYVQRQEQPFAAAGLSENLLVPIQSTLDQLNVMIRGLKSMTETARRNDSRSRNSKRLNRSWYSNLG